MSRFKLIDGDNRLNIKYSKLDGIFNFGDDNAYPSLVESIIRASVTAKLCVDINSKNISGKGFLFAEAVSAKDLIVNKDGLTINQLLRLAGKEFSEQNNLYFHVNYNALHEITSVKIIPTTSVRIGKSDSTGYSGKFVVYDNFDKSKSKKIEKKDFQIIDRFNPNPEAIELQVESAGGWGKYRGQILHVKADLGQLYSLSDADCVLGDCDSESRASKFKNSGLRNGFFGAKMFVTKPFTDDSERRDFENTVKDLTGVENSSSVIVLEASSETDELDKQFLVTNIDTNINDAMFESTEKSTTKNIRKAFGVPSILVEDSDNSIFGDSGKMLEQAKLMMWENRQEERNTIVEAFELIFSRFHISINPNNDWTIKPLVTAKLLQTNE